MSTPRTQLSSLKLPEPSVDDTKSSPNHAALIVQRWLRSHKHKTSLINKSGNSKENLESILNALDLLNGSSSFEKSQREVFGEKLSKALQTIVELLPYKNRNLTLKAVQSSRIKSKKAIASAMIISKFPENILFTEDPADHQSAATNLCLRDAKLVVKALRKFATAALKVDKSARHLNGTFSSLVYALRLFSMAFEKWQIEDKNRTVKSLEDSFAEAYSAYIACKAAVMFQNADPALLHAAEHQLDKLRSVMVEVIGPSCGHRLEELCAAVEISMPVYQQMKNIEEEAMRNNRQSNKASPASSADNSPVPPTSSTSTGQHSPSQQQSLTSSLVSRVLAPSLQHQEPIVLDRNDVTAMKYLDKLSQLTGIDPEQLAYEITLDKFYRLPVDRPTLEGDEDSPRTSSSSSSTSSIASNTTSSGLPADASHATVALLLRKQLLESMADKMVNSLSVSNVQDISQLAVGMVVPVRLTPNTYKYNTASTSEGSSPATAMATGESAAVPEGATAATALMNIKTTAASTPPILSARITAIHCVTMSSRIEPAEVSDVKTTDAVAVTVSPNEVNHVLHTPAPVATAVRNPFRGSPGTDIPLNDEIEAIHSQAVAARHAISKARTPSPGLLHHNNHNDITCDVEYIYERNMKEENVSVQRIKLAIHRIDASHFLTALADLCYQIAAFTPHRHDIINNIFTAVDFALLRQIIETHSCEPVRDLLPPLQYLQRALMDLQAPSRVVSTQEWINSLAESFYEPVDPTSNNSTGSGVERKSKSFQAVVPLLPQFFERASDCIEEIQRDMANFYISALVPVMQRHGALFISRRFQQRLIQGEMTLDATASLLLSQVNTPAAIASTVADIVESGAIGPEGFTVSDLETVQAVSVSASDAAVVGARQTRQQLLCRAVTARAFLSLLQVPIRLDSRQAYMTKVLPETLMFDAARLAAVRDYIDKISLESALVITTRQILSRYKVSFKDSEEIELQHRLDVLLTEKDVNFASITVEVVKYVKYALFRHREVAGNWKFNHITPSVPSVIMQSGSPGSASHKTITPSPQHHISTSTATAAVSLNIAKPLQYASENSVAAVQRGLLSPVTSAVATNYDLKELQERVERTVKDVIAPGNAVLTLFTKRVYKILLRVMLGQPYADKLQSYSLQSKGQERNLVQCINSILKVFNHSYAVHGDLYAAILSSHAMAANAAADVVVSNGV